MIFLFEKGGQKKMITYRDLYRADPEVARQKIVEVWEARGQNVKVTARLLYCSKNTVKKAIARHKAGVSLKDFSRRPSRHKDQTPIQWEEVVVTERKKTGFGRIRLERQIREKYGKRISTHTIRNILRRGNIPQKRRRRGIYATPHVYNLSQIQPLTHWQMDVKEIFDYKALGREIYEYFESHQFPPYQWTAIDPKTKVKFLAYSFEKTLANGNAFRTLVTLWLRLFWIREKLFFQTDGGVEFGAESLEKLDRIQKIVFDPLNVQLGRIRIKQPQDNAYVERTHRTDDEEFYVPQGEKFKTVSQFVEGAAEYLLCFNTRRWHYGREMDGKTPLQRLRELRPDVSQNICKFPVLLLDQISSDRAFIGGHDVPAYYLFSLFPKSRLQIFRLECQDPFHQLEIGTRANKNHHFHSASCPPRALQKFLDAWRYFFDLVHNGLPPRPRGDSTFHFPGHAHTSPPTG